VVWQVGQSLTRAISTAIFGQRFRIFWMLAGMLLLIFGGFRTALMIACRPLLAGASWTDILNCLFVGMRYDAMPIGFALTPLGLAIALAPAKIMAGKFFRMAVAIYIALTLTAAVFIEAVGMQFFLSPTHKSRLNWVVLEYMGGSNEVMTLIWQSYPVGWFGLLLLLLLIGTTAVFRRLLWRNGAGEGSLVFRTGWAVVAMGLCFLAIRGGIMHPLWLGEAYFCQNKTLCELSLNNVYTLSLAIQSQAVDSKEEEAEYPLPEIAHAQDVAASMFYQPGDEPVPYHLNPLMRQTQTGKPMTDYNVVVIIMESMSGKGVGVLGNSPSYTPFLDSLATESLYFDNIYAVGSRTCRGMIGILCGRCDLRGQSLLKRDRTQGQFATLPEVFRRRGYKTLMTYGGNPDFDNMKGFFSPSGLERMVAVDKMDPNAEKFVWGVHDRAMFQKTDEVLNELGDQKFFTVALTLSNHEPYNCPNDAPDMLTITDDDDAETALHKRHLNCYRYADWSLEQFFKKARQSKYFKNTIFLLVSDHGRGPVTSDMLEIEQHRLPCMIYAPGIVAPGRVSTIGSQADIAPTLLALLGGQYTHCFMGRNLLAVPPDEGFAMFFEWDRMVFLQAGHAASIMPNCQPVVFDIDPTTRHAKVEPNPDAKTAAIVERMLSLYKTSLYQYMHNQYQLLPE